MIYRSIHEHKGLPCVMNVLSVMCPLPLPLPCFMKYYAILELVLTRPDSITIIDWGPFHKQFFHCNSNSMEISFQSHLNCVEMITMKFCTWHDSHVVMVDAKCCSDRFKNLSMMMYRAL